MLIIEPQKELSRCITTLTLVALVSLTHIGFFQESGFAQQGFKWGRTEIQPGIGLESKYSDNVFLRPIKNSDFIFTISPSLVFKREKQKGDNFGFLFRYSGEQELFVRLKGQDYYNQYISGNLELGDLADDINWNLGGNFANARNPISPEFASSVVNIRQIRTTYELNSNLLWKITQNLKANIEAQFSRNLFSDDEQQEYNQYTGSGGLNWQITALTGAGVNYSFRSIDYLVTSTLFIDNVQHSGSLAATWKPFTVFSSEFHIGLSHTSFPDVAREDRDDVTYNVQLEYQPKSTSEWILASFQEIPISFWLNNPVYRRTVFQLTWSQVLGVKWESKSLISFESRKYDTAVPDIFSGGSLRVREDDYYYGLFSLTYSINDRLKLTMEYSYINNDSNFQEVDYSSNVVS